MGEPGKKLIGPKVKRIMTIQTSENWEWLGKNMNSLRNL
jgi:hypothetical protein